MNSLKKFIIGFAAGIGIAYWYLHYYDVSREDTTRWFSGTASNYRSDKHKSLADEAAR